MDVSANIARNIREVFAGNNWPGPNIKEQVEGISWEEANLSLHGFNSMVRLMFHVTYYIRGLIKVLKGGPLDIHDKFSFDHPPVESAEAWETFLAEIFADVETFAQLVEAFPDERLGETMADPKYGDYYRNLQGVVEHTQYHLGQMVLIKKLLLTQRG